MIVPTYNSGPYLAQAIKSILSQTYGDWEAVLVDDASTDDTFAVATELAGRDPSRIKAIRLERNQGVAGARNAAIATARPSELIALLDHDDYWRDDFLERTVALYDAASAAGRSVGIVACNALIHLPEGLTEETVADRSGWVEPIGYDDMIDRNHIFARALFARAAYRAVGWFSSECPGYDDYDLWLRIMEAGYDVITTREPLAVYRLHPTNMSRDRLLMAEGAIAARRRALHRGALTPRQRRAVKARLRHHLALRERALVYRAIAERRPARAAARALRAAPYGLVALLQHPGRWSEWTGELAGRTRGAARHAASRTPGSRSDLTN